MLSYDYYMNHFLPPGAFDDPPACIPPDDWHYFSSRAEEQLARYKRIYTVTIPADLADSPAVDGMPRAEAMAICAMAEVLASIEAIQNGGGGPVSSASIGSVSVSYGSLAANSLDLSLKNQERELYRCASRYLDIYRGVR